MTGIDDSSWRIAPVTGIRIPGTVRITGTARTLREKARLCFMVVIAFRETKTR